jgi:hypothetical protein
LVPNLVVHVNTVVVHWAQVVYETDDQEKGTAAKNRSENSSSRF